jgi:glycosyltransferase involved in cell wall biosynthesis
VGTRSVVLYDAYPHAYGGAQRLDVVLLRSLLDRGWRVTLMAPGEGVLTERARAAGIDVQVVPASGALDRYGTSGAGHRLGAALALPRYWWRLTSRLRRLDPAVVHVVDARGGLMASVAARCSGGALVWHAHVRVGGRWVNAALALVARAIVVPTAAVLAGLPAWTTGDRVRVVPNLVPARARRTEPASPGTGDVLVTIGRLHPQKGIDVLIAAAATLRAAHPTLRVVVVGGPDPTRPGELDRLQQHAAALGLGGRVTFTGEREDPESFLEQGSVYVQSSRLEALPLALLEAMAIGIPVVATDVGGVSDIVADGETGLLVPPEDPAALAAAIERLLTDVELRDRVRTSAFALATSDRFTPDGYVDAVLDVYHGVTSRD